VILKRGQNIKFLPHVFTEHGAIMAANVLNSSHAVQMSVFVIRAFVRLRHIVTAYKELAAPNLGASDSRRDGKSG
jgi:hypothetical protein